MGSAQAVIYRCATPAGEVLFTDQICAQGEEVKLPPGSTYVPQRPGETGALPSGIAEPNGVYRSLRIMRPTADETIRSNTGEVPVELALEPALSEGHLIVIYLDGKRLPTAGTGNRVRLTAVSPGAHRVQARVIDSAGNSRARSGQVQFFLRRGAEPYVRQPTDAPLAPQAPAATRAPGIVRPGTP
jgi:hypothetical protein